MSSLKHDRIFDSNSYQFGNGEEAAIINTLIQILPECQLVILFREQPLKETETAGIAFSAIDFGDIFLDETSPLRCCWLTSDRRRSREDSKRNRRSAGVSADRRSAPESSPTEARIPEYSWISRRIFAQNFFQPIRHDTQESRDTNGE